MPLYIRDESVAELARELKAVTGAKTVTEAVKSALEREIAKVEKAKPPEEAFARALAIADSIGDGHGGDPDFNFKRFREELWGDK